MLAFLVRRLSIGFLTLLLITCGVYGLVRAMPGSPITMVEDRGDLKRRMSKLIARPCSSSMVSTSRGTRRMPSGSPTWPAARWAAHSPANAPWLM